MPPRFLLQVSKGEKKQRMLPKPIRERFGHLCTWILLLIAFSLGSLPIPGFSQHVEKRFIGVSDPTAGHIRRTPDGGYLLSGTYGVKGANAGMLVMKTDGNFQEQWTNVLQSSNGHLDYGIDAIATADGGYLVLGAYDTEIWKAPLLAKLDYCLVKLDAQGEVDWAKRYGASRTDLPYELVETNDGGYLVSGYSSQGSDLLGNPQPFLLKVNANGDLLWSRLQRNFSFNIAMALLARPSFQMKAIETQDGGVFYGISAGEWAYLVKMSANGSILWQSQLPMGGGIMGGDAQALWGVAAAGGFIADIKELPNGDLALLGNVFYFIAIGNGQTGGSVYIPVAYLCRITATGQVVHAQAFFHPTGQSDNVTDLYASALELLPNGHYLIGGAIGGYKGFLMELDASAPLNQASVWARGVGSLDVEGFPYDYDVPHLTLSHTGDYVLWYDRLKLQQIAAADPTSSLCTHSLQVQSFPFSPQVQAANVTLDSIMQVNTVAYQSISLSVSDTVLCSDGATDLEEEFLQEALALQVYPNPASNQLFVRLPESATGVMHISILDLSGRVLQSELIRGVAGEASPVLLRDLTPGLYLVRGQMGAQVMTTKLVIQK